MKPACHQGLSQVPSGQPSPRLAWVERALARHRGGQGVASRLATIPAKRLAFYRKLLELIQALEARKIPVLLDTGCGTGQSTRLRAGAEAFVLGIDKSLVRLCKEQPHDCPIPVWTGESLPSASDLERALAAGALLARAEIEAFLSLLYQASIKVAKIDMLYPNPWPKSQHFGRRLYGHPVWPLLLEVGQAFELRTNWEVYGQEFAHALSLAAPCAFEQPPRCKALTVQPAQALTAFEEKYARSNHALYQVLAHKSPRP